jgi:UDP-N-acetylmuramyl pentapeptide synthase
MKSFILNQLAKKARRVLDVYKPTVISVTGSVGKTSTRAAIAAVMSEKFRVRTAKGNYNTDVGVPLTILGVDEPGRSPFAWLAVFWKAQKLLMKHDPSYPNMLVLEFGADAPGDMSRLCDIAPPDVSVLTAISPVHLSNYPSLQALMDEEATNVMRTKPNGLVVLNADDPDVIHYRDVSPAPVVSYGFTDAADVRADGVQLVARQDASFEPGEKFGEMRFVLATQNSRTPMSLPNLVGEASVRSALAAAAVGLHFGLSIDEIAERLLTIEPVPGRMRPLAGIKGSLLLDDSYNAAPASMRAALNTLQRFSPADGARRIAALGSMAELGPLTIEEHRALGREAAIHGVDLLVTVGEPAMDTRAAAIEAGIPEENAMHFSTSVEAGRFLDIDVKKGDVVLVKGSQSARMEKVTKDLMAEPTRSGELLVRQYGHWLVD